MPSLWYKSRTVEFDLGPVPAANAKAFFFLGGAQGSPITVYADAAEGSPHPTPVLADGNGRWPAVFIPYVDLPGSYGIQVLNEDGVQLWLDDFIPNPNPVEGEAVIPVPESAIQTGMVHWEPVDTVRAGYVRANGRTVGNAASGATERANADTQALFEFLWNAMLDAQAPVLPGGRGSSAASDFTANKNIKLPDLRGSGPVGLDSMGASAGGFFTNITFTHGGNLIPGSLAGSNIFPITVDMLPPHAHAASADSQGSHTHGGATAIQNVDHTHSVNINSNIAGSHSHGGSTDSVGSAHTHTFTTAPVGDHNHSIPAVITGSTAQVGGGNFSWASGTTVTTNAGAHSHTGTTDSAGSHAHSIATTVEGNHQHNVSGNTGNQSASHSHTISADGSHVHGITIQNTGSGAPTPNLPRSTLGTWYIKL